MTPTGRCHECLWAQRIDAPQGAIPILTSAPPAKMYTCHRYPPAWSFDPATNFNCRFPVVTPETWCGEFRPFNEFRN